MDFLKLSNYHSNDMVHFRDPETRGHLERMSRFSKLIAQELAIQDIYQFNDECQTCHRRDGNHSIKLRI